LSVTAPGVVGSMTAMNIHGFAQGVHVIRGPTCNAEYPGINSLSLVRDVVQHSANTREGLKRMIELKRGVTWTYPLCDKSGDCVVTETGRYEEKEINPLDYVPLPLRSYLPTYQQLKDESPIAFNKGVYIREFNYTYPKSLFRFNKPLFEIFSVKYPELTRWDKTGYLFDNLTMETAYSRKGMYTYFSPQREEFDDVVIATNHAIVPQMRITHMNLVPLLINWIGGQKATQYRYDQMNRLLHQNYGKIDLKVATFIAERLSPERELNFTGCCRLDPKDPMTGEISGAITIMDLTRTKMYTKSGYWKDGWVSLTLSNYFN